MGHKNARKSKSGMSLAKKKNIKGGKMSSGKKTKAKSVVLARRKLQTAVRTKLMQAKKFDPSSNKAPEVCMDDVLDMIDDEDLKHLKGKAFKDRQYLVSSPSTTRKEDAKGRKRKFVKEEEDLLESQYENKLASLGLNEKRMKDLLPLKTSKGLMSQSVEVEDDVDEYGQGNSNTLKLKATKTSNKEDTTPDGEENKMPFQNCIVSVGKLVAEREEKLMEYKLRIATLCTRFMESPHDRMTNLDAILKIMETQDPAVHLTLPVICISSLYAVFKDVLPSYPIKHHNADGVKLKKDTLQLQTHESMLLSRYTMFLKRLERMVSTYCPRKRSNVTQSPEYQAKFGVTALRVMSRLLVSHLNFNLSENIINFIIPYLNNWNAEVRYIVSAAIKTVFTSDKRGEKSYEIVRRINTLVKANINTKKVKDVYPDVLDVLLSLRIKKADLEKEKEEETVSGNKRTFKQKAMLSKRLRKKAKELVLLENELLEASAEENKARKSHFLTEITKLLFTIYFRALKTNPSSNFLSKVLEGLVKFADVINIEFFDDLLKVLESLLKSGNLRQRQTLQCTAVVLSILDGQGAALTLDPTAFHKKLYASLANLHCGKIDSDVDISLNCVSMAIAKRQMPGPRVIAFAKRLASSSLQVEHNDAMGILMGIKEILKLYPTVSTLLDSDGIGGSGVYNPELEDPDHSCANTSTLWELATLKNHYHPWVGQAAKAFVDSNEKFPVEITKFGPSALCSVYNSKSMTFNPPPPEKERRAPKTGNRIGHLNPRSEYFRVECRWEEYTEENNEKLDAISFL